MTTTPPSSTDPVDAIDPGLVRAHVAQQLSERRSAAELSGDAVLSPPEEMELAEHLIWDALDQVARQRLASGMEPLGADHEESVCDRVLAELFGLGGFDLLLADESIEDIFVNGCDDVIVSRTDGRRDPVAPVAESDEALVDLINGWAAKLGRTERRFDAGCPRLDLRLPGGFRLHAIMGVTPRPTVTIRCARHAKTTLADLVGMGSVDPCLAEVLAAAVASKCNIIVAGGTGSGKTTLLRALLAEVPASERIITVEDTAELCLRSFPDRHPNVVELETRDANVEGVGEITMADLTRECLRMSPDRVVVGEVRGGEALAMLKAMGQGNDGSMCTLHADSARGVHPRLRGYCAEAASGLPTSAVDQFFRTAVDLVIHLERRPDRRRVVTSLVEVVDDSQEGVRWNDLFVAAPSDTARVATRPSEGLHQRLVSSGRDLDRWHQALATSAPAHLGGGR